MTTDDHPSVPRQVEIGERNELLCPRCGHGFMHQAITEVFERQGEDGERGLHVKVTGSYVHVDTLQEGNPSYRRQGLRVSCVCEGCGGVSSLTIVQHKGQTLMEWEETAGGLALDQ